MAAINITRKMVEILVNGTKVDEFYQRDNSGSYDVDVSGNGVDYKIDRKVTETFSGAHADTGRDAGTGFHFLYFPNPGGVEMALDMTVTTVHTEGSATVLLIDGGTIVDNATLDYDSNLVNDSPESASFSHTFTDDMIVKVTVRGFHPSDYADLEFDYTVEFNDSSGSSVTVNGVTKS